MRRSLRVHVAFAERFGLPSIEQLFLHERFVMESQVKSADASVEPIVMRLDTEQACIERSRNPNLSTCGRCCRPWSAVKGHSTDIDDNSGMFPLCESCWSGLTPEARLPYYLDLVRTWKIRFGHSPYTEEQVTAAVLSESA